MVLFTIIIISHGREELLRKCLDSLGLPREDIEVIVVANNVTLNEPFKNNARVIESSEWLSPGKARNLALREATGPWVYFVNEDCYLNSHYWENVLPHLANPKIDVIGGPSLAAAGLRPFSRALSIALASPFCTGATFSRYQSLGKKMVMADEEKLSISNLWIRKEYLQTVEFPEDFLRGEEILLLQELKQNRAGIYYHPKLIVYQLHEMRAREFLWEGYFRAKIMKRKLDSGQEVFWLPAIFVLLHLLILVQLDLFLSLAQLYCGIIIFVSLGLSMKSKKAWLFPLVALMHYLVVFFYGVGFLLQKFKYNMKNSR